MMMIMNAIFSDRFGTFENTTETNFEAKRRKRQV
jgi:hypothetical protein